MDKMRMEVSEVIDVAEPEAESHAEATLTVLHVNKDFSGTGAQRVSLTILSHTSADRKLYAGDSGAETSAAFVSQLREAGVRPVVVRGLTNRRVLLLPLAIVRLAMLIRRERVDLVHSHSLLAGVAARLAALLTRTPCVHTFHGAPSRRYKRLAFIVCCALERALARITRTVIFNTAYQMHLLRLDGPRSRVIHNYLPAGPSLSRTSVERDPGRGRVLFLGRFEFQKNPEFFLRLAGELRQDALEFRMVGGGKLESELRALDRELGAGVEILPFSEDPSRHYDWADCMVLCSRYESFPLVIGEALSRGCRVVCSAIDGLGEIWGGAVRFYPEGSLASAVSSVREAVRDCRERSPVHPDLMRRFGVANFARAHQALYDEILPPASSAEQVRVRGL
jgi:glycosyltransferase involved in cell wall biosynthesis